MIKQLVKFMLWGLIAWVILLMTIDKVKAGSLYWTAYSTTHYAPYVESSCYNNYSYLSTCNNTGWAYVNSTPVATGTTTSLNYNWNSGSITIGGVNIGSGQRMLVITGYWQHPGTAGQSSTVYFVGRYDDGLIVNINNTQVINDWAQQGPRYWNSSGSFTGTGGEWYPIVINWYEWHGSANMDIHYSLSNLSTNSTSGWLDMNNNHFALTVTPLAAITSSQQTEVNTAKAVSQTNNKVSMTTSGDGLDLDIIQDGTDNLIIGSDLSSASSISGTNNEITLTQKNSNNVLGIDVDGNSNNEDICQDTDQRAIVNITGNSNTLDLEQLHLNNNGDHFSKVTINGNSNSLTIDQKETGDKILFLDVDGSNNVQVDQKGTGSHYLDINLTDSHTVDVTQDGSGSHDAKIHLSGNPSSVTLTQDSSTDQNYYLEQNCSSSSCSATVTQN